MSLFKTTWFKCIACLLLIAVISGALLAVLNDLLFVSPEMRTARAITKIYGEEKEYSVILDTDGGDGKIEYDGVGCINKIYEVSGDILLQTTGYKGYKQGTVTLWVLAVKDGDSYAIEKVLLESFEKQTLMGKLTGEFYGKFEIKDITENYDKYFSANQKDKDAENYNPVSGATYSATAAVNAVNSAIRYLGGER